jgi:PucR family transcriptional regulator, purine catabolism regulatory protein
MFITVKEALKLPELKSVSIVAGHEGLERKILSVNIMEVPDISDYVKEGDLLITTMYPIRDEEQLQRKLIPMLHEKGVAALAIAPLDSNKSIPAFMLEQAEMLAFPLLGLPYGTSFNNIINPVLQNIVDRQTRLLQKNAEVNHRFISVLINGGSLGEIAGMIHAEDAIPVIICSPLGNILAAAGDYDEALFERCKKNSLSREAAFTNAKNSKGGTSLIWSYPVYYVAEHYATVFLFFPEERIHDEHSERDMVEQASNIIALEIARIRNQHTVEQKFRAGLIENILQGKIESVGQAIRMGKSCGWDLSGSFLPVVIRAKEPELHKDGNLTREDLFFTLQHTLDDLIQKQLRQNAVTVSISTETLALFSIPSAHRSPCIDKITNFIESYITHFTRSVWVGIGCVADDITHLPHTVKQAEKAVHIAQLSALSKQVIHYDELGVFKVLFDNASQSDKSLFMQETLGGILSQSKGYRDELIKTLKVFFSCSCNLRQAAKEMYMHYNTISYRIGRIEKLIGTDLKDAESRLNVQIALKLLELAQN